MHLPHSEETCIVEMRIWCRKISTVNVIIGESQYMWGKCVCCLLLIYWLWFIDLYKMKFCSFCKSLVFSAVLCYVGYCFCPSFDCVCLFWIFSLFQTCTYCLYTSDGRRRLPQGTPSRRKVAFKFVERSFLREMYRSQVVFPNTEDGSRSEVVFFQILQVAGRF